MASDRITGEAVVRALKELGFASTAGCIAAHLGTTDTRAIATAARKPVADGRITMRFLRRQPVARYRFVRMTAKETLAGKGGA